MRWGRHIAALAGLGALALATRSVRLLSVQQYRDGQRYDDIYYLPSPQTLPVLSLGFTSALADLIWCKSLVYFGEELSHRGIVRYIFAYSDAIITLDPDFRAAYRWAATAALYRPTAVSVSEALHAESYLERAVERWPDDGELQWDYGSLLRFELAPLVSDPEQKREILERATPHLQEAARLGAGPPWLALNNAELLGKLGRVEQAVRQLEDLHETVRDESERRDIEAQLARLKSHTYFEAMRVAEQESEAGRLAAYPYLSPDLYYFVGSRPDEAEHIRYLRELFEGPAFESD